VSDSAEAGIDKDAPFDSDADRDAAGRSARGASFLPLLVIPLLIVLALVAAMLFIGWLTTPDTEPRELVRELAATDRGSWRKALSLANLLRDPQRAELKRDSEVAAQLGSVLSAEIDAARMDEDGIRLRVFLCRALGEFEVPDVLPVLIRACREERGPAELRVRRSAIEAVAVLAARLGPATVRQNDDLTSVLLAAGRQGGDVSESNGERAELRSAAAFALGVLGGDSALEQLEDLLHDPCPDVRYNAATGLARHGREAATPVLVEMLDPANEEAVAGERDANGREWKRMLVITNALRAVRELVDRNQFSGPQQFQPALVRLLDDDVPQTVRLQARELLQALQSTTAD
jgi:hypothetical protein